MPIALPDAPAGAAQLGYLLNQLQSATPQEGTVAPSSTGSAPTYSPAEQQQLQGQIAALVQGLGPQGMASLQGVLAPSQLAEASAIAGPQAAAGGGAPTGQTGVPAGFTASGSSDPLAQSWWNQIQQATYGQQNAIMSDPYLAGVQSFLGSVQDGQNVPFSPTTIDAMMGQQASGLAAAEGANVQQQLANYAANGGSASDPAFQAYVNQQEQARQAGNLNALGQINSQASIANNQAEMQAAQQANASRQQQMAQATNAGLAGASYTARQQLAQPRPAAYSNPMDGVSAPTMTMGGQSGGQSGGASGASTGSAGGGGAPAGAAMPPTFNGYGSAAAQGTGIYGGSNPSGYGFSTEPSGQLPSSPSPVDGTGLMDNPNYMFTTTGNLPQQSSSAGSGQAASAPAPIMLMSQPQSQPYDPTQLVDPYNTGWMNGSNSGGT